MDNDTTITNGSCSSSDDNSSATHISPEMFPGSLLLGPAPLCTDTESEEALLTRKNSKMPHPMVTMIEAREGKQPQPIRVYIEGVFDLFHFGHARCLWQAKTYFPGPVRLLVGVSCDRDCQANKREPLMTNAERVASVRHCRYVDEVIPEAPWVTSREFVERYQIDFFCHDEAPYVSGDVEDLYGWLKEDGIFFATQRTPNISTTDLLNKIQARNKIQHRKDDHDFVANP